MKRICWTVLGGLVYVIGAADAANADLTNTRPIGDATSLSALQGVFDHLHDPTGASPLPGPGIDAVLDQSEFGLFESTASGGSVATFIIELAAFKETNVFGLFSLSDPSNKAEIFSGSDTAGAQALVSFLDNGDIKVNGDLMATGFGDVFGFYIDVYEADGDSSTLDYTLYTLDMLNMGGVAQALLYQGDDTTELKLPDLSPGIFTDDEWIVAFEDGRVDLGGSDENYTDLVVMVESIIPVPAPGAAGLAMVGFGMIGWIRRRTS
ncbi:MAG: hypothetical protein V3W34_02190 [Phycisphaerae bacterium]